MLYDISKQTNNNNYKVAYYGYLYKGKMTTLHTKRSEKGVFLRIKGRFYFC